MKEYIEIPVNLDHNVLISAFGCEAVAFYEDRIRQRQSDGKVYYNPLKTIYLWATEDKKTHQGYYSTYRGYSNGRKRKNFGRS